MATRNRTEDFIKLRSTHRPTHLKGEDTTELLGRGEGADGSKPDSAVVDINANPPRWLKHMSDIRDMERHIQMELQHLVNLHKVRLKVQFGVNRDEENEEAEINTKAAHIGKLFKTCEQAINDIDVIYRDDLDDEGGSDADLKILRNIKLCLINEINGLSRDYREKQREYLQGIQKQKGSQKRGADQQIAQQEKRDDFLKKGFTPDQIETIMLNEEMMEDRNKEFQAIYESIKNLHEMFQDLHGMVIEQGTVLDRIDYNMNLTEDRLKKGRKELEAASKYQEAGTFKLACLFLIVLIIGFSVALLLKISG